MPSIFALVAFSAVAVGAGLGRALVTTYLPVLLDRIEHAPGLIGTVMLVNTAAGFAVPLAVGVWSDRLRSHGHGRTLPVVLGGTLLAAGGLAAIALGHASSYLALAALASVTYVGLNAVTTGHRALIPENFDKEGRAPATAGEELALLLGTLAGVAAGGFLVELEGWAPFALGAAVLPVLAVPTVVRMRGRERPPLPRRTEDRGLRYYVRAARRPGVRLVLAAQGLWVLGYVGLPPFFVLYAEHELGLAPGTAGLLLAAFGIATGAAMLLAGSAGPQSHRALLLAAAAAMGIGLLGVAAGSSLAPAAAALLPVAVGFGVLSALGFPVFTAYIPTGEAGAYTALFFSVRSISSAVALPTAGWLIAATGSYRALFLLGGCATLAALIPLARLAPAPAAARRLARRVAPAASRAAILVAGTAAVLGAGVLARRTELFEADEWLFDLVHGFGGSPQLIDDVVVGSHIRNYAILTALVGLAAVRWGRTSPLRTMVMVAAAGLVAYASVRMSWAAWDSSRPQEALGTAAANDHDWSSYPSFPSGHVAVTTALAAAAAALVPALRAPLWAYAALIAFTRVSYGAHLPSDVISGIALGALAAALVLASRRPPLRDRARLPAGGETRAYLRLAARSVSAFSLAVFLVLFATVGPPQSPEGGIMAAATEHDLQAALLAAAAVWAVGAWWKPVFGAPLVLTGAALGVFAAMQYTPAFAVFAALAFVVPGVLFLLASPRALRAPGAAAAGGFAALVMAAGAWAAFEVHGRELGPAHPESALAAPPTWRVDWAWAGAVTPDGFTVKARINADGRVRLLVGTDPALAGARASAPVAADDDRDGGTVSLAATGLDPDTAYYYGIEFDGRLDRSRIGRLRTFPEGRGSFTFAFSGCARVGSNGAVFDAIRRERPLLYLTTGDLFYSNIDENSRGRFLDAYDRTLSPPAQDALHRSTAAAYVWDDHDYGGDGSDATTESRPAARWAYRTVVPHYPLAAGPGGPIYQAFSAGRVRFLLLDTRSERDPSSEPDDGRKSMLGAAQRAWLERELLAARDSHALTVVVSSVPWIQEAEAGLDGWGGYSTERAELSRFVARHRIRNLLLLAGDAHMLAIDDGSNSDYSGTGRAGFPVMHAGALDRPGSEKGGPYSEGAFPGAGQYGLVTVDDRGGEVEVSLSGRTHEGGERVAHRFAVPASR